MKWLFHKDSYHGLFIFIINYIGDKFLLSLDWGPKLIPPLVGNPNGLTSRVFLNPDYTVENTILTIKKPSMIYWLFENRDPY